MLTYCVKSSWFRLPDILGRGPGINDSHLSKWVRLLGVSLCIAKLITFFSWKGGWPEVYPIVHFNVIIYHLWGYWGLICNGYVGVMLRTILDTN